MITPIFRLLEYANTFFQSNEVLSEETCDLLWDRCHKGIMKGETKHLIVLSSVPVAYPRVVCNLLSSAFNKA
jgi:hypothetical protein